MKRLHTVSKAPRAHLFTHCSPRTFATTHYFAQSPFGQFSGPSPPRLPKEEQDVFEELLRQSTGAFSTPRSPPKINQSPDSSASDTAEAEARIESRTDTLLDEPSSKFKDEYKKVIDARGKGEELHQDVRMGARPEFEGDRNPKTGEVGGPKNDPLRWGAQGEWTYNGRATDF